MHIAAFAAFCSSANANCFDNIVVCMWNFKKQLFVDMSTCFIAQTWFVERLSQDLNMTSLSVCRRPTQDADAFRNVQIQNFLKQRAAVARSRCFHFLFLYLFFGWWLDDVIMIHPSPCIPSVSRLLCFFVLHVVCWCGRPEPPPLLLQTVTFHLLIPRRPAAKHATLTTLCVCFSTHGVASVLCLLCIFSAL